MIANSHDLAVPRNVRLHLFRPFAACHALVRRRVGNTMAPTCEQGAGCIAIASRRLRAAALADECVTDVILVGLASGATLKP